MMEPIDPAVIRSATELRRTLHRSPEISHRETGTARTLAAFLHDSAPDEIVADIGGAGLAAVYRGNAPGPTVMIRSELDALPIAEANDFAHRSACEGVSHKCGHDGHMAIVAALALLLRQRPPARGRVVLLFQPAEETGAGAAAVREDPRFGAIAPDYCFALHNLPGHPLHQVVLREGTFTMASVGMACALEGSTSHASEPEKGISPVNALETLLRELPLLRAAPQLDGFALVTLTHATLGERSFGIAPGRAELLATLRAASDADLTRLRELSASLVARTGHAHGLRTSVTWSDHFDATVNHGEAVRHIERAAADLGLATRVLPEPIRWSEDFGRFTQTCTGAMLGLGAGLDQCALHSPTYDFPDELIPTGVGLFRRIIDQVLS